MLDWAEPWAIGVLPTNRKRQRGSAWNYSVGRELRGVITSRLNIPCSYSPDSFSSFYNNSNLFVSALAVAARTCPFPLSASGKNLKRFGSEVATKHKVYRGIWERPQSRIVARCVRTALDYPEVLGYGRRMKRDVRRWVGEECS
jgi:hypothetical protein